MSEQPAQKQRSFSRKWFWTGLLITVLQPIPAGFILSVLYLSEPGLRTYGRNLLITAVVWGALFLVILMRMQERGLI